MFRIINLLVFQVIFTYVVQAQLTAWGDTTICQGGQAQLFASGGGTGYYWTSYPTDPSLTVPQTQNPIVSPDTTTMYVVQSNIATGNLIFNGSFELGNVGFSSEYFYNPVTITEEGTYAVVTDAHTVHPNFFCNEDHTTGSGKFMAINGSETPNEKVWYLSLDLVEPDTKYEFATWITSIHPDNPAILQFSINGVLVGEPFQAYSTTCDWYQFFHIWDSDTNTTAMISIVNQNTVPSGNDFALDDISFATVIAYYDTVWVEVLPQLTSNFVVPVASCTGQPVEVFYTGNAADTAEYYWDFDGAEIISGGGAGPYQLVWDSPGDYTISLWVEDEGSCTSDTSYHQITIHEHPMVEVSADQTFIPYGESTTLHGVISGNPGPLSFSWFPSDLLADPNSLDTETLGLTSTTKFFLTVTDQSTGCQSKDSITIIVTGGVLLAEAWADPEGVCLGESTQLHVIASGGTGSYQYYWTSNTSGFTSDEQDPVVFPEVTTVFTVEVDDSLTSVTAEVNVIVYPLIIANAGEDTTIDYGTQAILHGTINTGANEVNFYWQPDSLLENPGAISPTTIPLTETNRFIFWVGDPLTGCESGRDTVFVFVEGGDLNIQIFASSDTICKGDVVELMGTVSGGYPPGYSFTWKDAQGNILSTEPTLIAAPESTSTYLLIVDDGFTTSQAEHTIVVNPVPAFSINEGSLVISACPFDSVTLKAVPFNEEWSYYWSNGSTSPEIRIGTTGIGFDAREFNVKVTNQQGCFQEREVTVVFDFGYCSSVGEIDPRHRVKLFPNPSGGYFSLEGDFPESEAILEISDLAGRVVHRDAIKLHKAQSKTLDLSFLESGSYQLILFTDGEQFYSRFIIF